MKRALLVLWAICVVCGADAKTQKRVYRVTTAGTQAECPIVVADLPEWAQSACVRCQGREIASQLDKPLAELAFVAPVSGAQDFEVVYSSRPARQSYPPRVHAQMWLKNPDKSLQAADTLFSERDDMYKKLHHHGPAFESEYAAYRIYFDKKQTIDTYGKKRPQLELAATNWYPSDEQLRDGYGHDNLRVFGSVGVGTLKGWDAATGRLVHMSDFKRREARIIAKGPVRTVVEMRVEGWRYGGREITLTSRYILYAGHSDVRVENRFEGDVEGLVFTTGVMKMAEHQSLRAEAAVAVYGSDFPENDTLKWERERVGLVVAVPAAQIVSRIDDPTSYLFQLRPDASGHIDYLFDMWWRKSEWLNARSDEQWLVGMLDGIASRTAPVSVSRIR